MTEEDWVILASLAEPTPLRDLPMRVAQRCLHLYKVGYLYTDSQGCVVLSLHKAGIGAEIAHTVSRTDV
jgi:hypothetical protein